ncbi:hypothetical protein LDENG_00178830 [Lucifuga dentata]|nr:hypothetical protein LDENG_00178830 [Lucifuga dentata]
MSFDLCSNREERPKEQLYKRSPERLVVQTFRTLIMFFFRVLLWALLLLLAESSSGGDSQSFSYDLSGSDLTRLYNSRVYKAEKMKRPLDGTSFIAGPLSHSGVRVTLADSTQWLVHKGGGFGVSSQTVVTNARHMVPGWKVVATKNFHGTKTVADFVKAGGSDYNVLFDNCHLGANRMMNQ